MKITRPVVICLLIISLSFLVLYFLLSWNVRAAGHDDLKFISLLQHSGWRGTLHHLYCNANFRWTAFSYLDAVLALGSGLDYRIPFLLYYTVSIVLFVYSIYSIITSLLGHFFDALPSRIIRLHYAVVFCCAFYFGTFQSIEVWHWITSSVIYLQSAIFTCLGIAFLLKKENSFPRYAGIALCFIYLGGASESLSLLLLMVLATGGIYILETNRLNIKQSFRKLFKGIIIAGTFLLVSSLINWTAPGTMARPGTERMLQDGAEHITVFFYSWKQVLAAFIQPKQSIFLLLSLSWIMLGAHMSTVPRGIAAGFNLRRLFFVSVALLAVCVLCIIVPLKFTFNSYGPIRAWMPLNLLITVLSAVWCFIIGCRIRRVQELKWLRYVIMLPVIAVLFTIIIKQCPVVTAYAAAYDTRVNYLTELNRGNKRSAVMIQPLPPAGMLFDEELSADTSSSANRYLKDVLELRFNVSVEE
jgi:hypothetical protein